jgi:class 3 adenylate cyclase
MDSGRPTAVIFAELIGAAELYAHANDAAAHEAISACADKLGQAAAATRARVVKRIGGRLLLLADNPESAARTAVALQVAAGQFPAAVNGTRLGLGVGFHYGPVIQNEADVFGDTVNMAARLVEQAARGQILLDADTAKDLDPFYRGSIRRLYSVQLKGVPEEISLCEIVWRADEPATFCPFDPVSEPSRAKLKLVYRGHTLVLRRIVEAVTMGRDPGCKLVIEDEHASRQHCTLHRRHDHFVLADNSTNGTFVQVEGEEEIMLQRDELTLRKRGWISFGQPRRADGESLQFVCD